MCITTKLLLCLTLNSLLLEPNRCFFTADCGCLRYEKASVEASLKLQRVIQQHPTVVGVTLRLGFTYSDRQQTHSGCVRGGACDDDAWW